MKKTISLVLSLLLIFSVFSCAAVVSAAEERIVGIDTCDNSKAWTGTNGKIDAVNFRQGAGSYSANGVGEVSISSAKQFGISDEGGIKNYRYFECWLYVSNAEILGDDTALTISMDDSTKMEWKLANLNLNSGWNKLSLSVLLANKRFTTLNNVSFLAVSDSDSSMVIKLDDICFSNVNSVTDSAAMDAAVTEISNINSYEYSGVLEKRIENLFDTAANAATQHDVISIAADAEAIKTAVAAEDESSKNLREKNIYLNTILPHGRTYYKDDKLFCAYSATGFTVRFYGTELKAVTESDGGNCTFNIYVDTESTQGYFDTSVSSTAAYNAAREAYNASVKSVTIPAAETETTLVTGLSEGIHTVIVLKRGEPFYTSQGIISRLLVGGGENAEFLAPPARSSRTIEFVGDSNTTGFGDMAYGAGDYSSDTQDATLTYGAYTAANLSADYSIVARSGCTVTRNDDPNLCTQGYMTDTYLYTDYWHLGESSPFDFIKQSNDVVAIHLGDNDHDGRAGSLTNDQFVNNMKNFIRQVRSANPEAKIILTFSICGYLDYRENMSRAVKEINEEGDSEVYNYAFTNYNNAAPAGHSSQAVHKAAGEELADFISSITGWENDIHETYADSRIQNGKLSIDKVFSTAGQTVTITPVADSGYKYKDGSLTALSGGALVTVNDNEDGTFSFEMGDYPVQLTAEFIVAPKNKYYYGDVDNNTTADSADALLTLQYSVKKIEFTDTQFKSADVNNDKAVDSSDALLILQHAVGKLENFATGEYYEQ